MDGIWSARGGKWKRFFDTRPQAKAFFTICGERYTVLLSGGSAAVKDGRTGERLARFKGFNYLYTGDIKPDETEFFALENGKHFYVFSLKNFTQRLRVTLPRRYEAIDVCGRYSEDGKILCVPAYKYDKGYTYVLFRYETDTYTLVSMEQMRDAEWDKNRQAEMFACFFIPFILHGCPARAKMPRRGVRSPSRPAARASPATA